jgi:glutamine amidotransferase-like uncharacterized protein
MTTTVVLETSRQFFIGTASGKLYEPITYKYTALVEARR